MKNILKRLVRRGGNKEGGFIEIIVLVIIALLLMKYFGITVSTVINWMENFIQWFMTFFKDILR